MKAISTADRYPETEEGQTHWSRWVVSADMLRQRQFKPVRYIVPGLVTEGATVFAGRPKCGKSWMVLDLGISVATGQPAFAERVVEEGDVLYLALEDGPKRL